MSNLEVIQIPAFEDNYIYLLHDHASGQTAVVDAGDAQPVLDALRELDWELNFIINTHHHPDHVGANLELKAATGCTIVGNASDSERIPGIDVKLSEGDEFTLGSSVAKVIEVSGHTIGHIAYWFYGAEALFCGDALFSLGCGRMFEGQPEQMWQSLSKLRHLPDNTLVYCAHEYTASNGAFALWVDSDNEALHQRMAEVRELREDNQPTVPSLMGVEKQANPFLRADDENVASSLGLTTDDPVLVFAELRSRKDNFAG